MADKPHRQKVTLMWNPDDVLKVFQSQFELNGKALPITLPLAATAPVSTWPGWKA